MSDNAEKISVQEMSAAEAAKQSPLSAVYMGTPEFASVILAHLLEQSFMDIKAVFTQPDRPAGRGNKLAPPPVKLLALEHNLPVHQPLHFRQDEHGDAALHTLLSYDPDVLIVAAYGIILPQRVLDLPKMMPVNVHGSLLPKYRGAAPIQRAIMDGECVTGITIMRMEAGLDSGPILMQRAVGIDLNDTSASLHDELAKEGADLLSLALQRLMAGTLSEFPQDDARATYAPKLRKEDGVVDLALSSRVLHARIRGLTPWPGARMTLLRDGQMPLGVAVGPGVFPLTDTMQAAVNEYSSQVNTLKPGAIIGLVDDALLVACADGCYAFTGFAPVSKKLMDAKAFYHGYLAASEHACFAVG